MPKKWTKGGGNAGGGGGAFTPRTVNGYEMFEVSSAMQKAIRRGDEESAMFWVVELWNSNFKDYIWKRLRIIVSEDVGLAEPAMPAAIYALWQFYVEQSKKYDGVHFPERLFLTQAVLMLCRAKKSRLVDWTLITHWRGHQKMLPKEIPDYAYDKHTRKGRKLGRGWDFHFEEGSHLENMAKIPGEKEMTQRARDTVNAEMGSTDEAEQQDMFGGDDDKNNEIPF